MLNKWNRFRLKLTTEFDLHKKIAKMTNLREKSITALTKLLSVGNGRGKSFDAQFPRQNVDDVARKMVKMNSLTNGRF